MSKKAASTKTTAPRESGASNGATVKDVPAQEFIAALAAHFKKAGEERKERGEERDVQQQQRQRQQQQ